MKRTNGVHINYVRGGSEGFTNFSKNISLAQETIDQTFSWPSNFSENISRSLPSILICYLRLICSISVL